jgi:PAS domain S-box-containing protein
MKLSGKILVVAADQTVRTTTRRILDSAGYETLLAQDGREALQLAGEQAPDLILLDVDLPDIAGVELCKQIIASPGLENTFVIMFSGTATGGESLSGDLLGGADGTITRLIGKGELVARLQAVLHLQSAEAAIRNQQLESRLLFESMTEMFALHELVYDPAGKPVDYRLLDCNPAFERITGIPRAQAIGSLASQLFGTGEAPYLDRYAPVAESGIPILFETEFTPLGKWFHISVFSPAKGRFSTVTSDITERIRENLEAQKLLEQAALARQVLLSILEDRKEAENSLRKNQAHLDLALQSARMGVWRWEIAGNRRYFDDQTCHLLGLDPATFGGSEKEFLHAVHPDDWETIQAAMQHTITEDVLYEPEYRAKWPDGSLHYLTARGKLIRDGVGQAAIVDGLIWDVTERKQAEIDLARQADEIARLYRASSSLLTESPLDLPALAQTILNIVLDEFGQSNCSLFLVENDSKKLTRVAAVGPYVDQVARVTFTVDGPGLVPTAIRNGQCINTRDVRTNPAYVPAWDMARSELTIPLKVGNQVIGAIDVQSVLAGFFSADDERLMGIFAERAALALEHARLYSQTERRLESLTALRMVDTAIASSFDINLTLGILLEQITKRLGIESVNILLFDPITQTMQSSKALGIRTGGPGRLTSRLGERLARRVIRERKIVAIEDLAGKVQEVQGAAELVSAGFSAYLGMPLIAKGLIKGVLEIFQNGPISLDQEQHTFLDMLAGQAAIAIDSAQLFENLQGSNIELMMAYDETIEGWSQAMDLRDRDTEGHSRRVTDMTVKLAAEFGCHPDELIHIRRGALLHDIGKLGVPDEILRKPGALTDEEWVTMRKHPQLAYDMLAPITYLHPAIDIPFCHHEKWDGSGYPRGLVGNQIPLAARIFTVVDVYDALTSDRPYRKAWTVEKALEHLKTESGKHFDPQVLALFLKD